MVDHHVEHGATQIDDRVELVAHVIDTVVHLDQARGNARLPLSLAQHITAVCRHHIVAVGTQKSDILHNNLTAHAGGAGKGAARDRARCPLEFANDCLATLIAVHHAPSSIRRCFNERSKMGAEWVSAPELIKSTPRSASARMF